MAGCHKDGVVLDPFGGSGTTAGVAIKYGRKAILCELNNNYIDDMYDRINSIIDGHIPDETKKSPLHDFLI